MEKFKTKVYNMLNGARDGGTLARIIGIFILSLILLNVIAVIAETEAALRQSLGTFLHVFELISVLIFSVEYLLRLWTCTVERTFSSPRSSQASPLPYGGVCPP